MRFEGVNILLPFHGNRLRRNVKLSILQIIWQLNKNITWNLWKPGNWFFDSDEPIDFPDPRNDIDRIEYHYNVKFLSNI